ncbi:hypothetical protein GN958_ATG16441 [Phytophthora infestans]|uniref:Uncharacterized protein n=1 Tax=Phytophthora infestans TaxID=4787 RepID=A0A8S9U555_PHYIN|nr:hypothetical protein GN958_ATG16441 [Phytophthora infestans]
MELANSGVCGWFGIAPCCVQSQLVHQHHRNKVLRQVLGRYYLHLSDGGFQGAIPPCVASKLMKYWPDERRKV